MHASVFCVNVSVMPVNKNLPDTAVRFRELMESTRLNLLLENGTRATQAEMAKAVGVSSTTFGNWCRGTIPSGEMLEKAKQFFGEDAVSTWIGPVVPQPAASVEEDMHAKLRRPVDHERTGWRVVYEQWVDLCGPKAMPGTAEALLRVAREVGDGVTFLDLVRIERQFEEVTNKAIDELRARG